MGALSYRNDPAKPASFGERVAAPLGRREATGFVVGESGECSLPEGQIKRITRRIDSEPLFDARTVELARWIAGMYFCAPGEALAAMLPSGRREPGPIAAIDAPEPEIGESALPLSAEQAAALDRITREKSGVRYLYGLTGSGKTEVFLQAAEATLAEGRGVIYLVPEIALTAQVAEAVSKRFGPRCALLHSGLSPSR